MLTYTDLIMISTFEERLEFLRTDETSSEITFNELRFLNQSFYNSIGWKVIRKEVIARDLGFDLGIPGREIFGKVIVHHMNPLIPKDIYLNSEKALDPEFLITVSNDTHRTIHYGYISPNFIEERVLGDTKLW